MVDPDVVGVLHTNCVAVVSEDLGDGDVTDDNVGAFLHQAEGC